MIRKVDPIEEAAADWLVRQERPDWDEQQRSALERWLAATPNRVCYLRLQASWKGSGQLVDVPPEAVESPEADAPPARRRSLAPAAIAASIALLLVSGAVVDRFGRRSQPPSFAAFLAAADWKAATTGIGQTRTIALQDGTRIQLNTNTELRTALGSAFRAVRLVRGEAFFAVAHDPGRPFHILADDRQVTVLGTKFGVRRRLESLEVAVVEGRVALSERGAPAVILNRDDFAVLDRDGMTLRHQSAKGIEDRLSWRRGVVTFQNASLAEAAAEINRYNLKKIRFGDAEASAQRISGAFDPRNIDGFSRLLGSGFGMRVRDVGNQVTISKPR